MNIIEVKNKTERKAENCCVGMDRFIKKGWVEKDVIKGHNKKKIYYKVPTNNSDENYNIIKLILQYCFICGKKIYPK
jgi:hypothetical protein